MARIFGEEGLNEPAAEVQVLQIEVAARPESASLFGALAEAAYKAQNPGVGDLAAAKAVALAPAARARAAQGRTAAHQGTPERDRRIGEPPNRGSPQGGHGPATPSPPGTSSSKTK